MKQNNQSVTLLITHNFGGGVERWIRDFCSADASRVNMILKSTGNLGVFGREHSLYSHINDKTPIKTWTNHSAIYSTSITNPNYLKIIKEVTSEFNISRIVISSFIGHSLDILNTGIKTIIVCHDYYPFCPAISIYFGKVCVKCDHGDLHKCSLESKYNRLSPYVSYSEWTLIRKNYLALIKYHQIDLVVPSASVKRNLIVLEPTFNDISLTIIGHGIEGLQETDEYADENCVSIIDGKLKILILGRLEVHKGLELLIDSLKEILKVADIFLIGCGANSKLFNGIEGVNIIKETYSLSELAKLVRQVSPDIAILLSVVPETFSYTLSELMHLHIPPLATRIGSFEDRIIEGNNGFLFYPHTEDLINKINFLNQNRELIFGVKNILKETKFRSSKNMLDDYDKLFDRSNYIPRLEEDSGLISQALNDELHRSSIQIQHIQTELDQTQSDLNQTQSDLNQTQSDLNQTQIELQRSHQLIQAMEASKFWKLRNKWLNLKRKMGVNVDV